MPRRDMHAQQPPNRGLHLHLKPATGKNRHLIGMHDDLDHRAPPVDPCLRTNHTVTGHPQSETPGNHQDQQHQQHNDQHRYNTHQAPRFFVGFFAGATTTALSTTGGESCGTASTTTGPAGATYPNPA